MRYVESKGETGNTALPVFVGAVPIVADSVSAIGLIPASVPWQRTRAT
jgi:hypothetical protein